MVGEGYGNHFGTPKNIQGVLLHQLLHHFIELFVRHTSFFDDEKSLQEQLNRVCSSDRSLLDSTAN
jgi:hypothetical protein